MGIEDDIRELKETVKKLVAKVGCPDADHHCLRFWCDTCDEKPTTCGPSCCCGEW